MPPYNPTQQIINMSLEELMSILNWVREHGETATNPITVLVGGWAVYAYNPWYGSIDIDLVTNNRKKSSLMRFLVNERRYRHDRTAVHTVYKPTTYGPIRIDFGNRYESYRFEGRDEELNFDILDGQTVLKEIRGGISGAVPTRSLLLLFKLKAAWDRAYRIDSETSDDSNWEQGKLIKDYADILALIDPNHGGTELDLNFLGEKLINLDFLSECLENISENHDALEKYRQMDYETARDTIRQLLSLTRAIG